MRGLSSGTGRFAPPKIEFKCSCGKRYRVSATKAGRKVRCKKCKIKITVPGSRKISMRSRKAILAEFGIDAEAAEKEYQAEKEQNYRCTLCATKLPAEELEAAYSEVGLMCTDCRAAQVADRDLDYKKADEEGKKRKKKGDGLDRWSATVDEGTVKKKAWAFGALFFGGTAGLLITVFSLTPWIAIPLALVVAVFGGKSLYRAEIREEE